MSNEVAVRGEQAVATTGHNPYLDAAEDMGTGSGGSFAKFNGNTGRWTYGQEQTEIEHGTQAAVNMKQFKRGHICWKGGKVEDEIMVAVEDGKPPLKTDLPDHGPYEENSEGEITDGWNEQASVPFRFVEGPHVGEETLFKSSSNSGKRSLANLLKDYGKQMGMHPGETAIVEIGANSFEPKDKKIGTKYAPDLKIVAWASDDELSEIFGSEAGENPDDYEDQDAADAPVEEKQEEPAKAEEPQERVSRRGKRF